MDLHDPQPGVREARHHPNRRDYRVVLQKFQGKFLHPAEKQADVTYFFHLQGLQIPGFFTESSPTSPATRKQFRKLPSFLPAYRRYPLKTFGCNKPTITPVWVVLSFRTAQLGGIWWSRRQFWFAQYTRPRAQCSFRQILVPRNSIDRSVGRFPPWTAKSWSSFISARSIRRKSYKSLSCSFCPRER